MSVSNSFWRELYDYIPGIVLIFRIGDDDQAKLIFANEQVRHHLGYAPDQYVLASETSANLQNELEGLVDEVARLSQKQLNSAECPFTLHDKMGNPINFDFKFRLFKLKANNSRFLLIQLELPNDIEQQQEESTLQKEFLYKPAMVMESKLAKASAEQAYTFSQSDQNILLRGEPGVGKQTLAGKIIEWSGKQTVPESVDYSKHRKPKLADVSADEIETIRIHHITRMPQADQNLLAEWIESKNIRVIATTTRPLEDAMSDGEFDEALYYRLSFQAILIAPLRNRKEDLKKLIEVWVRPVSEMLGLGKISIDESLMRLLLDHNWPENFREFYRVMRRSLLEMQHSDERLNIRFDSDEGAFESQNENFNTHTPPLLSFDEMNRQYLQQVLEYTDGKIYGKDGAASILGLKPTTLQSKLKKLKIR